MVRRVSEITCMLHLHLEMPYKCASKVFIAGTMGLLCTTLRTLHMLSKSCAAGAEESFSVGNVRGSMKQT